MEGVDVVPGDLVELYDGRIGDDIVLGAIQDAGRRCGFGQVLVAVAETLDDPCRLDVDEHGIVVRRKVRLEHADDIHFQWVDPGKIECGFR